MMGYEVQYFSKVSNMWRTYSFNTESYQVAKETSDFLESEGYLARILTYKLEGVRID